jgi:hypothetical protein
MVNFIMLSVAIHIVMLSVIMLSVAMLNSALLSVVVPLVQKVLVTDYLF